MRRPIIISGISGAGKSFLIEQLAGRSDLLIPIKKLSTRKARGYEDNAKNMVDLEFDVNKNKISKCTYKYNYAGNIYGIKKGDIENVLNEGKCPLVIVRNIQAVKTIKADFPNTIVVYIKSAFTGTDLREILDKQGRRDIEIEERMHRHRDDLVEYTKNFTLYDYVFANLFDEDSLINQFDEMLRIESLKNPIKYGLIFVLMSLNPGLNQIYDEIIDAAKLFDKNLKILRIDQKLGDYPITKEILEYIECAELIVCDLTEEKPNVYYELGYARGKSKTVIHCAKKGTNLHFDVKDFHTVFYENTTDFRRKLYAEFKNFFNKDS